MDRTTKHNGKVTLKIKMRMRRDLHIGENWKFDLWKDNKEKEQSQIRIHQNTGEKREQNWTGNIPEGKLERTEEENYTVLDTATKETALECGVTHCGGFPVSLPEYRPLSTPGQLLPASEKIWVALSPSLQHHILLCRVSQQAKYYHVCLTVMGRKQ